MQEINLLQNKIKDSSLNSLRRSKIINTALSVVLILEIGLFAAFFLMNRTTQAKYESVKLENSELQTELSEKQPDLVEAKALQAQLKNLRSLVEGHVYWSSFFDELSKHTLSRTQFMSLTGSLDGKIHLEGRVGSYADLGKMLLGLSTSTKISNVKLLSANPSTGQAAGFNFSLDFNIEPDLFIKK